MTAQIHDLFSYRGETMSVAGISEGDLFDPCLLDVVPVMVCTACWRGYQAFFDLQGNRLVLDTLAINLSGGLGGASKKVPPPRLQGVAPRDGQKDSLFEYVYEGLAYTLEYDGGVLLAKGFLDELYVHMGFHPAWKYTTVIELIFESGVCRAEIDRSADVKELRDRILSTKSEREFGSFSFSGFFEFFRQKREIRQFVERCFDRRYKF